MAMKTEIYKCPRCGVILVLPESSQYSKPRCVSCYGEMESLDETFDNLEVIENGEKE